VDEKGNAYEKKAYIDRIVRIVFGYIAYAGIFYNVS